MGSNNANARVLGSYQADALQNITGEFRFRNMGSHATLGDYLGAIHYKSQGPNGQGSSGGAQVETHYLGFDASRVARTSIETRGSNTALAPRIIAY